MPTPDPSPAAQPHDPYAALRITNYRRYFVGNAFSLLGQQAAGAAIGWELYARTHSATALGLIGLVQVFPVILLSLPAGHLVDRLNRKTIILAASAALILLYTVMGVASHFSAAFPLASLFSHINGVLTSLAQFLGDAKAHFDDPYIPILLLLLFLIGCVRINQPARQTIMPALVPHHQFANAVTWNTSLFETSNAVGPMLAGFAIYFLLGGDDSETHARHTWAFASLYWVGVFFQAIQLINFALIKLPPSAPSREPLTFRSLLAGVNFVRRDRLILAVMTLDMFAVLLGGATALLPMFARDILHVGSAGYGWLRAAPSIGAVVMAIIVAHRPPMQNAGRNMLWAVTGFGIAIIVFGLSTYFWLSMIALICTGLCDNVSVVVRHTLVQLRTPDRMRGRVNAVNSVFISCSNELGGAESGFTAAIAKGVLGPIFGPMIAVAAGGLGTIAVVAAVASAWPEIKAVKQLAHIQPDELDPALPVETKNAD